MNSISDSNSTNGHHYLRSLERMNSYPVVTDSLVFALSYYHWIKSKNRILDSSLSMIENTLKSVKDRTEPIAGEKIKFIDETVCNQLEKLEKICPIILEPSPPMTMIHERLYSKTIEPSMKVIMWPFTKTIELVSKTSSATVSTMTNVLQSSMQRVRPMSLSVSRTTHSVLDKTDEIVESYLPDENVMDQKMPDKIMPNDQSSDEKTIDESQCAETAQDSVYTKVKRLSIKTQQRLYSVAISEINALQRISVTKIERLYSLIQEMQGKDVILEDRVIEGCESCSEPVRHATPAVPTTKVAPQVPKSQPGLIYQATNQIEQLQDIMAAVSNIKKYATTNTLVSLHFINTNLSLLKTVLIVNEKLLHQTVIVIDKIQYAIEYVMVKIKAYLKSQRIEEAKNGKPISTCFVCDSDSE